MIDKTYLIILKQQTKMRKILTYAVSALALASCSSDSLVSDSPANTQAPIAFNAGQKNITRTVDDPSNLEKNGYYNFGVWAYKVNGSTSQNVMANYLVGYNGTNGYPNADVAASTWYYDGLNSQVLRYWDHSYPTTNFYAYAPYDANASFSEADKTITVSATAGYAPTNDVIFAGKSVAETDYENLVPLQFKHVGAKVNIAFRENVAGYKVQLINLKNDTDVKGIQATPAIFDSSKSTPDDQYTKGEYNEEAGVTIYYTNPDVPTKAKSTKISSANLKFDIPTEVSDNGLVSYTNPKTNNIYNVLREGTDAKYVVSPTTYYAVVQPTDSETGFTFHVSYKLIAEDNGEEIIVRDARVFIPANMVKWESNKAYTYNFTITTSSTGNTSGKVVEDSPVVPTNKALNPIVFDNPTISDYDPADAYNGNI